MKDLVENMFAFGKNQLAMALLASAKQGYFLPICSQRVCVFLITSFL